MSDRELLELAAKAAGIELEYCPVSGFHWVTSKYSGLWWDPLNVDGDAFRLAVKLRLTVICAANHTACDVPGTDEWISVDSTDAAAARRAITEAAAKLGATL